MACRGGQTEPAVDPPHGRANESAGVFEVRNERDDGAVPDPHPPCERHDLKIITGAELIEYRGPEKLVERMTRFGATAHGEFTAVAFRETMTGRSLAW